MALRSRTPSPPLRSAPGGCVPQWSSSSSRRRTVSKAAPAAARSTWARSRAEVATSGSSPTGSRVVRPSRRARPTSPGSTTTPPPRGTSSRRASSSSAGVAASSGSTVCRAVPAVASPPWSATCSSSPRAASDSWPSLRRTSSGSGASGEAGRRPLAPAAPAPARPSATPLRARRPWADSHTSARSTRRSTEARTTSGEACTISTSSAVVVWPATTRASRTESSSRFSWSSARSSDARVAARDASCPKSWGAGVARSGRSTRRRDSRSSGQPRSWSARVRYPSVRGGDPDIPPTLPALGDGARRTLLTTREVR